MKEAIIFLIFLITVYIIIMINNNLVENFHEESNSEVLCEKKPLLMCENQQGVTCERNENIGKCKICPDLPDMTKYVLKSSIPACPKCPDLKNYI